jgi:uncharacterized cupin superfamily protein
MSKPILNLDELGLEARDHGDKYALQSGAIGRRIGARQLGYNLTIVPAGKRAYPFHNHRVNEEMFFVVSGSGELRVGSERYPIRSGDVIACPSGGPETAHQIINTSRDELRYLAVSTQNTPELAEYPDSRKSALVARMGNDPDGQAVIMRFVFRPESSLDYFDGED